MAGFLTHLLEGQNLSEFQKMAQDGDPKHLGTVGRNLTLIAINERARADAVIAEAQSGAERREADALRNALTEQAFEEDRIRDREEAMRRTGFKQLPKAQRIALMPDSDEGVDEFLNKVL